MEQRQPSTRVAGIDVGKHNLDLAVHGQEDSKRVSNDEAGHAQVVGWLKAREVGRVGLEASGGYERGIRTVLEAAGFEVVVHQPLEVKRFGQWKRWRIKNDEKDAQLIAAATAQVETVKAAQDPRLVELAERLTAYEQVTDLAAQLQTSLEQVTLKDLARSLRAQLAALLRLKARLLAAVVAVIKQNEDLLARFRLLGSLPGIGPVVAATLVVRMPELGQMKRGQAASLLGVAPFDRDSGQYRGLRFITGGRSRPRRMMYLASLAAKRSDPALKAFAHRLTENGKPPKLINVAIMRKLVEAANLVLARGSPWTPTPKPS